MNYLLILLALFASGCRTDKPDPVPVPEPTPTATHSPMAPPVGRIYGITLDDEVDWTPENIAETVKAIRWMSTRVVCRIVFNGGYGPEKYRAAVTAFAPVCDILGQPADSTYVEALSLDAYRKRFQDYVAAFPEIRLWETGNEVNGDWLGSGVAAKVHVAHEVVKAAGKSAVLVPYWNTPNCADSNGEFVSWIRKNISAKVKQETDFVLTSVYGKDCEDPEPTFEQVFTFQSELGAIFPNAALGLGEIGGSESASQAQRAAVIRYYYAMPKTHMRDIGFGGYWFYRQDMVPYTKPLWAVLVEGLL